MVFPRRPMPPMNHPSMFSRPFGYPPRMMQGGKPGLGGLLRRLFPGMGQSNPMQGFGGMGGMGGFMNPTSMQGMNPSTLQNLANPSNLSAMLGNVQKTLKMAESVVPMVQQYGPLVKNIPSMIKMYNAIKNAGNEDDSKEDSIDISDITGNEKVSSSDKELPTSNTKAKGTGNSVPKLYI